MIAKFEYTTDDPDFEIINIPEFGIHKCNKDSYFVIIYDKTTYEDYIKKFMNNNEYDNSVLIIYYYERKLSYYLSLFTIEKDIIRKIKLEKILKNDKN